MPLLVRNLQRKVSLPRQWRKDLAELLELALALEGVKGEVSLVLVDDKRIRELNKRYRGVDAPTDVLAFAQKEKGAEEPCLPFPEEEPLLGDVVISLETAKKQAEASGHGLWEEVALLFVHGLLHLLGYDHEAPAAARKMRRREKEILARFGRGEKENA